MNSIQIKELKEYFHGHGIVVESSFFEDKNYRLSESVFEKIMDVMLDDFLMNLDENDEPNKAGLYIEHLRGLVIERYLKAEKQN